MFRHAGCFLVSCSHTGDRHHGDIPSCSSAGGSAHPAGLAGVPDGGAADGLWRDVRDLWRDVRDLWAFAETVSVDGVSEPIEFVGRFCRVNLHRQGGLGTVLRAYDAELNREVALKVVRSELSTDVETRQRFASEMEITARLDHPGVIPIYGTGTTSEALPFYAMRFVDGRDLSDDIETFFSHPHSNFDSVEFRTLLQQFIAVCKTVAYAHNRGIVHRDVKPQNIRVGKYGETILLDWGLAVRVDRSDAFRKSGEASLVLSSGNSSSGTSTSGAGTLAYMSPEQLSGLAATPAADIYSLEATLFKIITGRSTIDGIAAEDAKRSVTDGRIPAPRDFQPQLPKPLDAICRQALALHPSNRYATALELAGDVENYLAGSAVSSYTETPAEQLGR